MNATRHPLLPVRLLAVLAAAVTSCLVLSTGRTAAGEGPRAVVLLDIEPRHEFSRQSGLRTALLPDTTVTLGVSQYEGHAEVRGRVIKVVALVVEVSADDPDRPFVWYAVVPHQEMPGRFRLVDAAEGVTYLTWDKEPAGLVMAQIADPRGLPEALSAYIKDNWLPSDQIRLHYAAVGDWLEWLPLSPLAHAPHLRELRTDPDGRLVAHVTGRCPWPVYVLRYDNGRWHRVNWYSSDRLVGAGLLLLIVAALARGVAKRRRRARAAVQAQ